MLYYMYCSAGGIVLLFVQKNYFTFIRYQKAAEFKAGSVAGNQEDFVENTVRRCDHQEDRYEL